MVSFKTYGTIWHAIVGTIGAHRPNAIVAAASFFHTSHGHRHQIDLAGEIDMYGWYEANIVQYKPSHSVHVAL